MVFVFASFLVVQVALIGQIQAMNLSRQLQGFFGMSNGNVAEYFFAVFVFLFPCVVSEVLVCPQVFKGKIGVLLEKCADYRIPLKYWLHDLALAHSSYRHA